MTVPYYISENNSDMRGIKHGCYAIEDDGNLSSGPFPSFEECVTRIGQAKRCAMNSSANAGSSLRRSSFENAGHFTASRQEWTIRSSVHEVKRGCQEVEGTDIP